VGVDAHREAHHADQGDRVMDTTGQEQSARKAWGELSAEQITQWENLHYDVIAYGSGYLRFGLDGKMEHIPFERIHLDGQAPPKLAPQLQGKKT